MLPSGLLFLGLPSCAPFIAQAVRVARFLMPRDIDEASLHIAVRFKACAV
jgi:hypothetical protein